MFVIRKLINFANFVCKIYKFEGIDFRKLESHFEESVVKELDFREEVANAERTRSNFKGYTWLHIPENNMQYSNKRVRVMEYVEGVKINNILRLEEMFGDQKQAYNILIYVFSKIILQFGYNPCDFHQGNILVRRHPLYPSLPQFVLLEHGFYCDITPAIL